MNRRNKYMEQYKWYVWEKKVYRQNSNKNVRKR